MLWPVQDQNVNASSLPLGRCTNHDPWYKACLPMKLWLIKWLSPRQSMGP